MCHKVLFSRLNSFMYTVQGRSLRTDL